MTARNLLVFVFYLVVVGLFAMPHGLSTEYRLGGIGTAVTPLSTNHEMQAAWGLADAGSYAKGAVIMARDGWIHQSGYFTLWPPGMFAIHALSLWLLGADGAAMLFLVAVNVAAWAAAFTQMFLLARRALPLWASVPLPLLPLVFPFVREYLLSIGIMMSEGLTIALWTSGILMMLRAAIESRLVLAAGSGVVIAIAAHVRGQILGITTVGTVVLVALVLFALALRAVRARRAEGRWPAARALLPERPMVAALLCALAFHICALPFLTYNYTKYGRFEWALFDYYYRYMWLLPEEYSDGARFILAGSGPVACHVHPSRCADLREIRIKQGEQAISDLTYRRLAVRAFVRFPLKWFEFRLRHLPPYWFSAPSMSMPAQPDPWPGRVLLACMVASLGLVWPLRRSAMLVPYLYALATAYVGSLAIFALAHFEMRYLYHLQFSALLLAIVGALLVAMERARAP